MSFPIYPPAPSHRCPIHEHAFFVTFDLSDVFPQGETRVYCKACLIEAAYRLLDEIGVAQALKNDERE